MKKGITKYLFCSLAIHILIFFALLLTFIEIGHLTFNENKKGDLTHVSIYQNTNKKVTKNEEQASSSEITKSYVEPQKISKKKPVINHKKSVNTKKTYKTVKNSSRISLEENKSNHKTVQKQPVNSEILKGGNEKNSETPLILSAKPDYGTNPKPDYPMVARRRGYEGEVVFNVLVLNDGNIGEMEMVKTSGHSVLDSSAEKALKNWKFIPGMSNGKYVKSWVKVPIQFRLNDI